MAESYLKKLANKNLKRVLYIGDDDAYWTTLKYRFQEVYHELTFEFIRLSTKTTGKDYQTMFVDLIKQSWGVVYVDCSTLFDQQTDLLRLLTRQYQNKKVAFVALVEQKVNIKKIKHARPHFIHIKCGEYHDVVYDPINVAWPKQSFNPEFARAKFKKDMDIYEDFRIAYITGTLIHCEGNFPLVVGDVIECPNNLPKDIVPSSQFVVKKISEHNLYYDYNYSYDLEFVFIDRLKSYDDEEEREGSTLLQQSETERQADYQNKVLRTKKKHGAWVVDQLHDSYIEKKTKVLIVNKDLNLLKAQEKLLSDYPYTIRVKTDFDSEYLDVEKYRPNIIAFGFQVEIEISEKDQKKRDPEDLIREAEAKSLERLKELINKIKKLDGYSPFLLLFNSEKFTSKSFQDSFKYAFVLSNAQDMQLKVILDLAGVLEKKQSEKFEKVLGEKIQLLKRKNPGKYRLLSRKDFVEEKYFLDKNNDLNTISYSRLVKVVTMTESELTFFTENQMSMTSYRLMFPVPMNIRIVPIDGEDYQTVTDGFVYRALIYGVDELDKKKIRQFVNKIFFTGLEAAKAKEKAEYEAIKTKAIAKRTTDLAGSDEEEFQFDMTGIEIESSLDDDDSVN